MWGLDSVKTEVVVRVWIIEAVNSIDPKRS